MKGFLEQELERNELLAFPACPFPLPSAADQGFLLEQGLENAKEIVYDPRFDRVSHFIRRDSDQENRLTGLFRDSYQKASGWLAKMLPAYPALWRPDVVRFHVEEEATRQLRFMARNDLLHVDAMFSRPTHRHRILRMFVNLHPTDPRVWATSESFESLVEKYGSHVGLPNLSRESWLEQSWLRLFRPAKQELSSYDRFMNRFHRYLKKNDDFQEKAVKHLWKFPPQSAWILFTDGLSHAELRGRAVLDFTFFIAPESLVLPEKAPFALLERLCGTPLRLTA